MYSYIEGRDLKLNPLGYMTGSFLTLAEKSTSKLSLTVSLLSSSSPGVDWPSTLSSGILSLDLKYCHHKLHITINVIYNKFSAWCHG